MSLDANTTIGKGVIALLEYAWEELADPGIQDIVEKLKDEDIDNVPRRDLLTHADKTLDLLLDLDHLRETKKEKELVAS